MENEQNKNRVTEIFVPRETPVVDEHVPEIEAPQTKSTGAIIGSIIIILVLIIGGLYFWGKQIVEKRNTVLLSHQNKFFRKQTLR